MNSVSTDHFAFGENWLSFLRLLTNERIVEAEKSIQKLVGSERMDGLRFADIGSGSGLFSLAARRLGAVVHSFDFDANSVAATQSLRDRYFPNDPAWKIEQGSILDQSYLSAVGKFDIAFSWGVLHHTGAMLDAVRNAAAMTKPDGLFIFALYRKTKSCGFWAIEKRWYSSAPPLAQKIARKLYIAIFRASYAIRGRDFAAYVADYRSSRGMEFEHDIHDWMGGYPYESIAPETVAAVMDKIGFRHVRSVIAPSTLSLLGSGCDEFVYQPIAAPQS